MIMKQNKEKIIKQLTKQKEKLMKRKLLRCMTAVATMLLATSCTSELALEGVPQSGVVGEEVEVTFSVSAQSVNGAMRAGTEGEGTSAPDGGPGRWQNRIGKGKSVDMLIYAVYEGIEDENGRVTKYTLLDQYGLGSLNFEDGQEYPALKLKNNQNKGQTIYYVGDTLANGGAKEITLRLMRNKTYHIAFWAQSSQTKAFDTNNLENVEVKYENALNNDELRDAFCKVETFSVTPSQATRTVRLTRPFAQINMGTTGADYKTVVEKESKKKTFTRSTVTLKGVARYFDVVSDKVKYGEKNVDGKEDYEQEVTFTLNKIPAYYYIDVPAQAPEKNYKKEDTNNGYVSNEDLNEGEEFLIVNLNDGENEAAKIDPYKITYPTISIDENKKTTFLTETFKYLSMCYVLVPAHKINSGEDDTQKEYTSSVLENVKISLAEDEGEVFEIIDINQVPVHRNWRTNILCGLYDGPKDPEDPNEPDDPTSIWNVATVNVSLNPFFEGEYNTEDKGDSWTQDNYNKGNKEPGSEDGEEDEEKQEEGQQQ